MATPEKDIERVENNLNYIQQELLKKINDFFGDAQLGKNTDQLVKQLKEWKLNIQKENSELKKRQKLVELATKEDQERLNNLKKINEQAKRPGMWQRFVNFASGTGDGSKDSFEQMYRVRQRFGGIEQIFAGNVGSGVSQLAGSFKGLAKIMGGPYYLAIQTVISGLLQFDKHLKEVNKTVLGQTGGYSSPYLYASASEKQRVLNEDRKYMRDLYMISQEKEILGSKTANFSLYSRINNAENINKGLTYNRAALQSMGIDSSTADRLTTGLMRTEGLNSNQSNAFLFRMVKNIQDKADKIILPEKQIVEETMRGFDANKKFNLSMAWVNNQVLKFNAALEKGTRTIDDFAAIQKSFYGGETGQLAGLANIIAESAGMAGVEIPQELLQNLNSPYALKMLMSDPEIMKKLGPGLQATAKRMAVESGNAGNALAEQGFLGDILQQLFKVNVSRQAVIDLQRSGYDFQKSGLLGVGGSISVSKRPEDQKDIDKDAEQFRKDVTKYQTDVTNFMSKFWSNLGEFKDQFLFDMKQKNEQDTDRIINQQQALIPHYNNPTMAGL